MYKIMLLWLLLASSAYGGVKTGRLLGISTASACGSCVAGLHEIDIDTGAATLIGEYGDEIVGLALSSGPDGTLYCAFTGEIDSLAIIDPETSEWTIVGPFGFETVNGLAFAPDGTLYGVDIISEELITVDIDTGQGMSIDKMNVYPGDVAFNPDGVLFAAEPGYNGGATLWRVDTQTAHGQLIGELGEDVTLTVGLAFVGETLYASAEHIGPNDNIRGLFEVDPLTGKATIVGQFNPDNKDELMGGLAFLPGPGDADRDGDVDVDDAIFFKQCFGPLDEPGKSPYCAFLDSDKDGDIDCDDWEAFIPNWTEETDPPTFPTCEGCDGDANGDGTVDPLDSGWVLARFGCSVGTGDPECDAADQNADGTVDPLDVGYVQARFGACEG